MRNVKRAKMQKVVNEARGSNKSEKGQKSGKTTKAAPTNARKAKEAVKVDANAPESVYRENGSYHLVVKALRLLGVGKFHEADKMIGKYVEICPADKLKAFKSKAARNPDSHKSWRDRIVVNATVCERSDYGKPLHNLGWCIKHERDADGFRFGLFRLNGKAK